MFSAYGEALWLQDPNLSPGEVEIVEMLDGGPVVLYNTFLALHSQPSLPTNRINSNLKSLIYHNQVIPFPSSLVVSVSQTLEAYPW